ncbi:LysR family transcriptional regulator [Lelliottia amnigena]|uniref:LysR family transcriptional regulator n=1 Tax=Lelliottia amnigena TaxID=61646 RepID=UPI004055F124
MKIRQLQYFLIVAEEQNFTRAASRVHIQQSPLSRAMRDLEHELGVALFERSKGRIRLTRSGEVFYEETRRLLFFLNNARARAQAAANGFRGHLRIALTDGLAQPHITELLATCRAEEPLTEIRILEMAVSEMVPALNSDQIDAGLTLHTEFETEQYVIDNVWTDNFVLAVPARHPLLCRDTLPLGEVFQHPLIIIDSERDEGRNNILNKLVNNKGLASPVTVEYTTNHETMMMLVSAGYGIGLALESQISLYRHPNVVLRKIRDNTEQPTTFIVRSKRNNSEELERFILRAKRIGET